MEITILLLITTIIFALPPVLAYKKKALYPMWLLSAGYLLNISFGLYDIVIDKQTFSGLFWMLCLFFVVCPLYFTGIWVFIRDVHFRKRTSTH